MYSNFWSVRRNTLASMAGANERGGGAGGEREEKSLLPSLPAPPPLFPPSLFPTPSNACYPGYNTSL